MPTPVAPLDSRTAQHFVVLDRNAHLKEVQVMALRQVGRTKFRADVRAGKFPAPMRLGRRCNRWLASTVLDWLANPRTAA